MKKNNVKDKEPTKAHKIPAKLHIPVITMNIDNLDNKAGSKEVYEIHENYNKDNIVLYGEDIRRSEGSLAHGTSSLRHPEHFLLRHPERSEGSQTHGTSLVTDSSVVTLPQNDVFQPLGGLHES